MIGIAGDGSFGTSNMNKHLKIYNAEKWTDLLAKEEVSAVDKSTMKTDIGIGCLLVSVVFVISGVGRIILTLLPMILWYLVYSLSDSEPDFLPTGMSTAALQHRECCQRHSAVVAAASRLSV